jgi:outer membrane protein OmpA-like peptidoglycan-associated protein
MCISGKGYGESHPLNTCECQDEVLSNCTAKEHQQNRRTEFIVVKM